MQIEDEVREPAPAPELSRGAVLYRRTQGFAKAAFVAAAIVAVVGVVSGFAQGHAPNAEYYPKFDVILGTATGYISDAFLIAGAALLALTAARTAGSDQRPSWAPLIDEQFARRADAFALIMYAYAGIRLLLTVLGAITSAKSLLQGPWHQAIFLFGSWIAGTAPVLFTIFAGALIIQCLVLVATRDDPAAQESEKEATNE